jgi:uridine kinase
VDAVGIVHADDFYLPTKLRGHGLNVVAGDQDYQRLIKQVLMPFKRGVPIRYQRYDWKNDRLEDWIVIEPRKVLIIEGIYSTRRELRSMYDLKIWVDCPPETGIARGIERDGEHMRAKWEKEWMPAWTRYARLHRPMESADIVMSGTDAWT